MLAVAVLSAAAVAGCSTHSTGTPAPVPTTTGTATSPSPGGGSSATSGAPGKLLAPPVPKPLKASRYLTTKTICQMLDIKQLTSLGLPHAKASGPSSTKLATGCDYNDSTTGNGISVSFETINKHGLSDIYAQQSSMAYWQPTTIQGYPAVAASQDDARKDGTCQMWVGFSNQLAGYGLYDGHPDPSGTVACKKAKQVASQMITTLIKYP